MGPGRHRRRGIVAFAAALALLAAVAGGGDDARGRGKPTLLVGIAWEPASLNPIVDGYDSTMLTDALTDPLLQPLPDGSLQPLVARRVPTTKNGDVRVMGERMDVAVRLRPAARWSDGVPVSCRDVRQLWQAHVDRRVMARQRAGWDLVRDVSCQGPRVAVLHFTRRYADYLSLLRQPPLPAHDLAGRDFNTWWLGAMPVSNGPYRLVRWRRGSTIVLERDPAYWNAARAPRQIERIEFRVLSDANVLDLQTSGGEVHMLERQLEAPLPRERSMFPNQRLHLAPRSGFEQLGFSMRRGTPTADVRVRQAIAYAIDREEIVRMLLHGSPFRVHDSVLVAAHGRAFVPAWQQYRPDGARVQALLRDAGYELGEAGWSRDGAPLELSLRMSADKGMRSDLAQLLQQQLADVGIILRIRLEEGAVFEEQTLERGAFDLALWPVGIDSPHGLVQTLGCGRGGGRDNHGGYCDPRVDRLLHAAARSLDPRAQADAFARVQRLVAADVPVLPLYQQVAEVVHHRHVEGVVINPHGGAFWNVQDWRVPA